MKLVLLPGLHGTTDLFDVFVDAAPAGWELAPLALPQIAAYDELVRAMRPVIEAQGRCMLLAESFSGPLGLHLADCCANVDGLVLASSFTRAPRWRWLRIFAVAPLFSFPRPRSSIRLLLCGRDADDALVNRIRALARALPPKLIAARVREALRIQPLRSSKPLLFLRGTKDRLVPQHVLSAVQADATVVRIDAPHALLQTKPVDAWRAIAEWAKGVDSRRA